jgi:hypothetical protein
MRAIGKRFSRPHYHCIRRFTAMLHNELIPICIAVMLAIGSGCQTSKRTYSKSEVATGDPIIVLDDWWNVDYIKNGCQMFAQQAKQGNPYASQCPSNLPAERIVSQFDNDLKVAFASDATCHGLSLLSFTSDMANAAAKNPSAPATGTQKTMAEAVHWSLMFDFDGRHENQNGSGWSLVDPSGHVFNGEITSPQSLASDICKVVKGMGGKIE